MRRFTFLLHPLPLVGIVALLLLGATRGLAQQVLAAYALGGEQEEEVKAIAVGADGSVYLYGPFQGTVDFDPSPTENTLTSSNTNYDAYLVHYTDTHELISLNQIKIDNPTDMPTYPEDVAVDQAGNIFVSMSFVGSITLEDRTFSSTPQADGEPSRDVVLAKYRPDGSLAFAHALGSSGSEYGYRLSITAQDKIILSGRFEGSVDFDPSEEEKMLRSVGIRDVFLTRFSNDGRLEMAVRIGGSEEENARRMEIDSEGNVILLGQYRNSTVLDPTSDRGSFTNPGSQHYYLAKYDQDFNFLFAFPIVRPDGNETFNIGGLTYLQIDSSDNIYLSGYFTDRLVFPTQTLTAGGEGDMLLAKFRPDGTPVFIRQYGGDTYEEGRGVVVDREDNIYLIGNFRGTLDLDPGTTEDNLVSSGSQDGFLAKLDAQGRYVSVQALSGEGETSVRRIVRAPGDEQAFYLSGIFTETITLADNRTLTSQGDRDGFYARYGFASETTSPVINYQPPELLDAGTQNLVLSAQVTDSLDIETVTLEYLKIRENPTTATWKRLRADREANTNTYSVGLEGSDLDELGVQTRFIATDQVGNTDTSAIGYTYRNYPRKQPLLLRSLSPAAGPPSAADYNLFSLPLQNQSVRQVLEPLGDYDRQRWRIWRLVRDGAGEYQEFNQGWSGNIALGEGYLLIYTSEASFQATGAVVEANYEQPYSITLKPGFNLIGNPYNFALNWDQVLRANEQDPAAFRLKTFNGAFAEDTRLEPLEGGLVANPGESDVTLSLPVARVVGEGGRISQESRAGQGEWELPLQLTYETTSVRGGIGMRRDAQPGYDRYDDFTVPRLADYVELNSHHPEFFLSKFSQDVVPPADEHVWELEVAVAHPDATVTLSWDSLALDLGNRQLWLLDAESFRLIDMQKSHEYTFTVHSTSHPLRVLYGSPEVIRRRTLTEQSQVGVAYPNPATHQVTIPVVLPQAAEATLEVYDATGKRVWHQTDQLGTGYQTLRWRRQTLSGQTAPAGLYGYRLRLTGEERHWSGRILWQ